MMCNQSVRSERIEGIIRDIRLLIECSDKNALNRLGLLQRMRELPDAENEHKFANLTEHHRS